MAAVHYAAFLAIILIFQDYSVTADFSIPFLSPLLGNNNPCRESVCGKGNCVVSSNSTFGYECECDSGWKQARSDEEDDEYLNFLPCVIPNSCFWTYCGGGSCNKTSIFIHTCECEEGYYNLFNSTAFPCYKECAFGLDCASLGLNMNNSTTSRPDSSPSLADDSRSHSVSLIPGDESGLLIITMATTLALVVWKYS